MAAAFATDLSKKVRSLDPPAALSNRVTPTKNKSRATAQGRASATKPSAGARRKAAESPEAASSDEDPSEEESEASDDGEPATLLDSEDSDAALEAEFADDFAGDEESEAADADGDVERSRGGLLRAPAPTKGNSDSLARFDPMQAYMREVQQHPLLTPDEEKALAVRYAETGDLEAAARLVTANLRLVVKLAYEYRRAYRNMMDLVQEGNMGLMQAVKKYDPYRGVKLSSYAAWWIRAYMLRYILANWRMVKLGTTQAQRKLFFNLNKERARLSAMGIEPTNAEIAKRLEVTEVEVEEMDKRLSKGDASLDLPVSENDGRQIARVELMPAMDTTPDIATESAELGVLLRKHLAEFRATLTDKDLIIFDERLVADEPRTLQDLGEEFGVSRERVRQLEARITGRLRAFLGQHLGDAVEVTG